LLCVATAAGASAAATPAGGGLTVGVLRRTFTLEGTSEVDAWAAGDAPKPVPERVDDDSICERTVAFTAVTVDDGGASAYARDADIELDGLTCGGGAASGVRLADVAAAGGLDALPARLAAPAAVAALAAGGPAANGTVIGTALRSWAAPTPGLTTALGGSTVATRVCNRYPAVGVQLMALSSGRVPSTVGPPAWPRPPGVHLLLVVVRGDRPLRPRFCLYRGGAVGATAPTGGDEARDEARACFPADAAVEVASGATVPMRSLAVGDVVRVAAGDGPAAFSPVYTFSHRQPGGAHPVVSVATAAGPVLTASGGHLVPSARRGLVAAAALAAGDAVDVVVNGTAVCSTVTAVSGGGRRAGLYAPHTLAGTVVVDGVVASCYTTAVRPAVAAALLAPVRWAFGVVGAPAGDAVEGGLAAARWAVAALSWGGV